VDGAPTEMEAGIKKLIRRVLATTVAIDEAGVVVAFPPADGVRDTVTFAGEIVPSGNPDPVTVTLVTPG
jgi:hypothetical protein